MKIAPIQPAKGSIELTEENSMNQQNFSYLKSPEPKKDVKVISSKELLGIQEEQSDTKRNGGALSSGDPNIFNPDSNDCNTDRDL